MTGALPSESGDTWPGYALIFVNRETLAPASEDELNRCVSSALDCVLGFPIADTAFDHRLMPAPEVRRVILDAACGCALERDSDTYEVERTRNRMTPLPDKKCIAPKLRAAHRQDRQS